MKRKLNAVALALAIATSATGAIAQTVVTTDITANTTWGGAANPSPIILGQTIFVKNNATLTILPGTVVRGQPRQNLVVPGSTLGSPGALIVTQNGRINASGTATQPIIFTTAAVDNDQNGVGDDDDANGFKDEWVAGDLFLDHSPLTAPLAPLSRAGLSNTQLWGGLVVLGSAPINLADKCGVGYGKCFVEGLTVPGFPPADATYGGIQPHDNSGVLRFVSIRYAGDEIGNSNELNGLTLGGVGDGTTLENVEVFVNFDDGFEWFGGTVNGSRLAVFFVGDDMFDIDEGYTGVNQFLFGVMPFFNERFGTAFGSASGDKAGEFDGDNFRPDNVLFNDNVNVRRRIDVAAIPDPTPTPFSQFSMFNMTVIGTTPDAGQEFVPPSVASTNRGLQFRNGGAGNVFNSIVVNTGAETGIEIDGGATGAPGFDAINNVTAAPLPPPGSAEGRRAAYTNLVCSTLASGAAPAAGENLAITNGNSLNLILGGTAAGANTINSVGFNGLVKEDQTFDPEGVSACPGATCGKLAASLKTSPINPRPAAGFVGVGGCTAPAGPGLDRSATYRGAFQAVGSVPLWTTGWTALNQAGLLAN